MINKIKKFIEDNDTTIAMTICVTAGVLMGAWAVNSAYRARGGGYLEIPGAAVKDLLAGKEVLLDCLEDAYLKMEYIPKV